MVNLWGVLSNFVFVSVREVYDGGVKEPSILLSQVGSSHSLGAIMEDTILYLLKTDRILRIYTLGRSKKDPVESNSKYRMQVTCGKLSVVPA